MTRSKRIYVLDTNVLMHDPTALFKFEEHDVFIPMKGHSEASRNARQVSRFLNEIIVAHGSDSIDEGVKLVRPQGLQLRSAEAIGRLMFQLKPVEVGKRFGTVLPDNQILGSILQLIEDHPGVPVVLVSKDINLRIKASICGVKAEDYENDRAIDDFNLLFTGATELPEDFWERHEGSLRSWTDRGRTFYEVARKDDDGWYPNQFLYMPGDDE
uniref:PIN domain-containing protein n=1 Tax=uncultured Arenimonas sp. TaxID=546226 RepID=UPI0030DB5915